MSFIVPWQSDPTANGSVIYRPILDTLLVRTDGQMIRESFLVDSGADNSMGPRELCDRLGYDWALGTPTILDGIAGREECQLQARIHPVDFFIREAGYRLTILVCFAEGDAPLLLGRDGFFDAFRVQFDKPQLQTVFELV